MIHKRVTEYEVFAVAQSHPNRARYALRVCNSGEDRWSVRQPSGDDPAILRSDGVWTRGVFRAQPGSPRWKQHHHDLETALRLAEAAAPNVEVDGVKARDVDG